MLRLLFTIFGASALIYLFRQLPRKMRKDRQAKWRVYFFLTVVIVSVLVFIKFII